MRTYVRLVREYAYTITEHDPDRPWMVLGSEHRKIKLPDGLDFFAWAHDQWPAPRWSVELDPWQLAPACRNYRSRRAPLEIMFPCVPAGV